MWRKLHISKFNPQLPGGRFASHWMNKILFWGYKVELLYTYSRLAKCSRIICVPMGTNRIDWSISQPVKWNESTLKRLLPPVPPIFKATPSKLSLRFSRRHWPKALLITAFNSIKDRCGAAELTKMETIFRRKLIAKRLLDTRLLCWWGWSLLLCSMGILLLLRKFYQSQPDHIMAATSTIWTSFVLSANFFTWENTRL